MDRQARGRQLPPRLRPVRVVSKDRKTKNGTKSNNIPGQKPAHGYFILLNLNIYLKYSVSRPLPPIENKENDIDIDQIADDENTKVEVPIEQVNIYFATFITYLQTISVINDVGCSEKSKLA